MPLITYSGASTEWGGMQMGGGDELRIWERGLTGFSQRNGAIGN